MEVPVLLVEFEGVVADLAAVRHAAFVDSLGMEGISVDEAMLAMARGYSTEEAVRRLRRAAGAPEDETAVELGRLRAERGFACRVGKGVSLRPGSRDALERLATHCRLSLVTRASRREVEFVLGLAGIDGLFRPIITADDVSPPKPAATPWLAALTRVGHLFPGQTLRGLAVEDHIVGLRAARRANLACVAVGALPAHEAVEADAWVESLADLTPERVRGLTALGAGGRR